MCCRLSVKPLRSRDKPCVNSRGPVLVSPDRGGLEDRCVRRVAAFFSDQDATGKQALLRCLS